MPAFQSWISTSHRGTRGKALVAKAEERATQEQLELLEKIVSSDEVSHGVVLTMSPINACVAAKWLKARLGSANYSIVLVTAQSPLPKNRPAMVKRLAKSAARDPKRIVVVSTYRLLGMGLDGL